MSTTFSRTTVTPIWPTAASNRLACSRGSACRTSSDALELQPERLVAARRMSISQPTISPFSLRKSSGGEPRATGDREGLPGHAGRKQFDQRCVGSAGQGLDPPLVAAARSRQSQTQWRAGTGQQQMEAGVFMSELSYERAIFPGTPPRRGCLGRWGGQAEAATQGTVALVLRLEQAAPLQFRHQPSEHSIAGSGMKGGIRFQPSHHGSRTNPASRPPPRRACQPRNVVSGRAGLGLIQLADGHPGLPAQGGQLVVALLTALLRKAAAAAARRGRGPTGRRTPRPAWAGRRADAPCPACCANLSSASAGAAEHRRMPGMTSMESGSRPALAPCSLTLR
jgi:hypothetical protein